MALYSTEIYEKGAKLIKTLWICPTFHKYHIESYSSIIDFACHS